MAGVLARFGGARPWLDGELEAPRKHEAAGRAVSVRCCPAGLPIDEPIESDGGP